VAEVDRGGLTWLSELQVEDIRLVKGAGRSGDEAQNCGRF
jgi:hypothetical protein